MGTDSLSAFESSLQGLADSCVRTTPEAFTDTLSTVIEEPAVGVDPPFDGVSLDDTPVSTDFDADDLLTAETGVTPVGLGVADYGTVTVRSTSRGDELASLFAPRHVAVVHADDIVADMPACFDRLADEFGGGDRTQVLTTGPSATADMGALIQGVHGPESVHVVVIE